MAENKNNKPEELNDEMLDNVAGGAGILRGNTGEEDFNPSPNI